MSELSGRRFHRLFGIDGRSVVVAMDHGITDGAVAGFENPQKVLEQVIAGGADAILTSIGIARHFSKQLKDVGLLIRCDGATSPCGFEGLKLKGEQTTESCVMAARRLGQT